MAQHGRLSLLLLYCVCNLLVVGRTDAKCMFGDAPDCLFSCHCKNAAACDPQTGDCPDGCDDGSPGHYYNSGRWYGPGCQTGNIAFGKSALQCSTFGWDNNKAGADNAVDGGTFQHIPGTGTCAYHRPNECSNAWWEVNLGKNYVIYNITIFNRADCCQGHIFSTSIDIRRATGLQTSCGFIALNDLAYNFTTHTITKQCTSPIVGQYLKLYRTGGKDQDNLNFCEVYIEGYEIGPGCSMDQWGPGCLLSCNCQDTCHRVSGVCSSLCVPGWQGDNCQQKCDDNLWGENCSKDCNCMNSADVCSATNGSCILGCAEWFKGTGCDLRLPSMQQVMPTVPSNGTNPMSIRISFQQLDQDSQGDIPVMFYEVQYKQQGVVQWTAISQTMEHQDGSDQLVEVAVTGLQPDTPYSFRIVPVVDYEGENSYGIPSELLYQKTAVLPSTMVVPVAMIGGIIAGVLVLIIFLILVIVFIRRRRQQHNKPSTSPSLVEQADRPKTEIHENPYEIVDEDVIKENEPSAQRAEVNEIHKGKEETESEAISLASQIGDYEEQPILYENLGSLNPNAIPVPDLAKYIQSKKQETDGFKNEYESLPHGAVSPWEVGNASQNKEKNRFKNFRAYDHSRVVLNEVDGSESTDYINANYIKGYKDKEMHYIASQGPHKHTVADMWQMIWQEGANRIVMVTNVTELGRNKCFPYWPESGTCEYGPNTVTLVNMETFADFTIRTCTITRGGKSRIIRQFHFTSWPDNGVPQMATALLEFHRKVRSYDSQATGPMVVHCSAGIGRTGTFLALDYLLEEGRAEKHVDVLSCIQNMHRDRFNMVQTQAQYVFVYDALLEALQSENTAIPCPTFQHTFSKLSKQDPHTNKSKLQEQFELLNVLKSVPNTKSLDALKDDNKTKNRFQDIVPANGSRPFLTLRVPKTNDYINASYVNGYKTKLAYLVTQSPLPSTIADIWRLAADHQSPSIIALNGAGSEDVPIYWPSAEHELQFGPLKVELVSEDNKTTQFVTVREFRITNCKRAKQKPSLVKQFNLTCWPEKDSVPSDDSAVLDLLDLVEKWQMQSENGPIIVHCIDGASRSGLLVAAMYLLDKLKIDQEVDVFHTVKYIRINRPQLVTNQDQYSFLHHLAGNYMERYEMYANFK